MLQLASQRFEHSTLASSGGAQQQRHTAWLQHAAHFIQDGKFVLGGLDQPEQLQDTLQHSTDTALNKPVLLQGNMSICHQQTAFPRFVSSFSNKKSVS